MKKKNIILLCIVCILSVFIFASLVVYAFIRQEQKDAGKTGDPQQGQEASDPSEVDTNENITPTIEPQPTATTAPTPQPTTPPTTAPNSELTYEIPHEDSDPIILGFAGDVNLDESYYPVKKYDAEGQDINQCFSADLLQEMQSADVMMLNNEFAYSNRGTKASDKSFTFRAKPERVQILKEMGVDIVSLANNHALDYGQDALMDSFDTLDEAGISYVGAGENVDRAKAPVYYKVGNKTIAYVSASHVIFAMDWYASDTNPGMIGTYDPTMLVESIKEAKENSDYVVVFVHWGVERATKPEKYQRNLSKIYIDAGADAVIGCHPHVMQGIEFYQGKPIAYSLGNYWFNASEKESGMLKLYLKTDGTVDVQLLPAMNKDTETYLLTDEIEKKNYYNSIKGLSYDIQIDEDGFLSSTNE
jgi:poly-gamma-glutamate synthesis protein (capsule biosynthesis protein)